MKQRGSIYFLISSLGPLIVACAEEQMTWSHTFGGAYDDGATHVRPLDDGGYILTGFSGYYGPTSSDAWIVRTNENGCIVWERTFGGDDSDGAYAVEVTADGGYILVGSTESFGPGGDDCYLVKTDKDGLEEWSAVIGGADEDIGYSVLQTPDGGYIAAGRSGPISSYNGLVFKTSSDGVVEWIKTYGGPDWDEFRSIIPTNDNDYILAGTYGSQSKNNDASAWVMKIDAHGEILWNSRFGGPYYDGASTIIETVGSEYLVVGTSQGQEGDYDALLLKIDSFGNQLWSRKFGGSSWDTGSSVWSREDGGGVLTGYTQSYGQGDWDAWLVSFDDRGMEEWFRTYGGPESDDGESVHATNDGGYIIAGATKSFGSDGLDAWLLKTDENGDIPTGIVPLSE